MRRFLRKAIVVTLTLAMLLTNSVVALAAQETEMQEVSSTIENAESISPRTMTQISNIVSSSCSGYFRSSFTVPSQYSGKTVYIMWQTTNVSNKVTAEMRVEGPSGTKYIYIPVNGTSGSYAIGNLSSGTYTYTITADANFTHGHAFYVIY